MKMFKIAFTLTIALWCAACGPLDRTEKTACESDADCVDDYLCNMQAMECQPRSVIEAAEDAGLNVNGQDEPKPWDQVPGAKDAILDSIGVACDADSECADGLHCIDNACTCCEFILENTSGSGYRCQQEMTPSEIDVCVPRVGEPEEDEFLDLGTDCGSNWECAGDLMCAGDASCGNSTLRGCEGDISFDHRCMCCVRIASSEDELFPGAFDCSDEPAFYREHCE